MSDFRKPRPDIPIVPQSAILRKVKKPPKRPKGRKGRKPKGKPSGQFVSRQDPNYLLRKAEDEARQAREDRRRRLEQEERQIQLQIEDRRDRRVEARRADALGRQQLQLAQARFAQDAAVQREQLRLQGEAQQETARFRVAQLTQGANQGAARAREAEQLRRDNFDIYGTLQRLYRQQERREGENLQLMRDFLTQQSRRVQLDPAIFRSGHKATAGRDIQDATPFGERATADQRRQRRNRSRARSETPVREPEPEAQAISDAFDSIFSSTSSSSGGSSGGSGAEEVLPRARSGGGGFEIPTQPRILRGDPEPRRRFSIDQGATEEEISQELRTKRQQGGKPRGQDIRAQEAVEETTDLSSDQLRELGGGSSGSEETQRRGEAAGRRFLATTLVRGASRTEEERRRAAASGVGIATLSSGEEEELAGGGSLISQYFPEPRPEGETRGIGRPLTVGENAKRIAEQRRAEREAQGLTASQLDREFEEAAEDVLEAIDAETEQRQEAVGVNLRESGVLVEPPSGSESSGESEIDLGLGGFDFSRPAAAAGRGVAAVGGAALRGAGGLVQGVGEGIVEQLPTAGDVGRAVGRTGYQGIVAAGGLLQGAARGALAATADPEIGEQVGATLSDRRALRRALRNPASGRQPSPPRTPPPLISYLGAPGGGPPPYSPPTTDSEID